MGWCRLHCHVCCQHQQCRVRREVYHECRLVSNQNPSYVLLCLIFATALASAHVPVVALPEAAELGTGSMCIDHYMDIKIE